MIVINLLPPGRKGAVVPPWVGQLPWKKIAAGAAAFLMAWSCWVLLAARNQSQAAARFRAEWEALQPERIKLEQRQATLQAFRNRESILKGLKASESRWAPRLNFLSDVVVSDLWFTLLNFGASAKGDLEEFLRAEGMEVPQTVDETGSPIESPAISKPFVLLVGSALVSGKGQEGPPVSRFLQKLKEHPEFGRWFSGMELKGIRHRQVKSEEVSDFILFLFPTAGS
ncbi:MAG: hypothetical protein HYZ88_03145 [Candidatus Omnitrophica bacterium]|nr:hypothetical protein [Candidatus Omnitrophota bacterium]